MTNAPIGNTSQSGGGARLEKVYQHYLAAPATGANNVVSTASGSVSNGYKCFAISYTGVDQTTPANITAKGENSSVSTISATGTTTVDDCWAVSRVRSDSGSVTNGTNYTGRGPDTSQEMGDSNGTVGAAGSKTATAGGPTGILHIVTIFIAPVSAGATPSSSTISLMGVG